ncbi:Mpv17/PMP22 [Penicillium camemberti]|uniref:Mpv17/PMP22 n=1 Tax=Penicillium camemberti (strain FM 013) TaxID=1429867 RepID=A0A0G4PI20_PENC3|nr:Mpv17/PMP22 [Penicillium camemberti]
MPSLVTIIVQSATLKAFANITAQILQQLKSPTPIPLDWNRVLEFAVFGIVSAPLISLWQRSLDETFPTQNSRINWPNVLLKLLLDQTIGLFVANVVFIICTTGARLQSGTLILQEVQARIFRILLAAWKIWPAVSLVNFLWVPWHSRVVVTSLVGFGWNIILSVLSSA